MQLRPIKGRGEPDVLAAANQLLAPSLRIREPIQLPERHHDSSTSLQLSWWAHGEVSISRLQGPGLTLALEPLRPLCTLLLPADGQIICGHARENLTCQAGHSLAYLPACRWQQTNHCGLGLGLHCTEEALHSRLLALAHRQAALAMLSRLGQPMALALAEPHRAEAYRQEQLAVGLSAVGLTALRPTASCSWPCSFWSRS